MIESAVPSRSSVLLAIADEPERDRRHRWRINCRRDLHGDLRAEDRCLRSDQHGCQRAERDHRRRNHDQQAFLAKVIGQRAHRRLREHSGDPAESDGESDLRRIPVQRSGEIDRKKWPDAFTNIGEKKIQRIERVQAAHCGHGFHLLKLNVK